MAESLCTEYCQLMPPPLTSARTDAAITLADQEATARRAFDLWRRRGCPEGREVEIWREAERELRESAWEREAMEGRTSPR